MMTVQCPLHQKNLYNVHYIHQQSSINFKGTPLKSSENCLEWWSKNNHSYLNLAKLAKQYLCIPATSVPAEQVFSVAGEIVNTKRASLKPESVNLLIFLSKHSKFLSTIQR